MKKSKKYHDFIKNKDEYPWGKYDRIMNYQLYKKKELFFKENVDRAGHMQLLQQFKELLEKEEQIKEF